MLPDLLSDAITDRPNGRRADRVVGRKLAAFAEGPRSADRRPGTEPTGVRGTVKAMDAIRRWGRRAPHWQLFLVDGVLFGALLWLLTPASSVATAVGGGVIFGAMMSTWQTLSRKAERDTAKVGDDGLTQLNRAIKTGQVPADPRLHEALARMVQRHRKQLGWLRIFGPVFFTLMAALGVFLTITDGPFPNLLYLLLFVGLDVFYVVWPITFGRKLDRISAQLGQQG